MSHYRYTSEQETKLDMDAYASDIVTFIDDNIGYDHPAEAYYDYLTDSIDYDPTSDPF